MWATMRAAQKIVFRLKFTRGYFTIDWHLCSSCSHDTHLHVHLQIVSGAIFTITKIYDYAPLDGLAPIHFFAHGRLTYCSTTSERGMAIAPLTVNDGFNITSSNIFKTRCLCWRIVTHSSADSNFDSLSVFVWIYWFTLDWWIYDHSPALPMPFKFSHERLSGALPFKNSNITL